MYGPLCWQACENDHGGSKKLMWYGIMEFDCKVTSTWSNCGREKEMAFTPQQFGEKCGMRWTHEVFLSHVACSVSSQEHTVLCTR